MLFKLLYTLYAISGVHSHMEKPIVMDNTMASIVTNSNTMEDTIAINIEEGDTLIRNLCSDFVPYITDNTCTETLFEVSKAVDFVAINKTNMILKPKAYDLDCYYEEAHAPYEQGMYNCFPKTYQFTISALHLPNKNLIKDKMYQITVKNISLSGNDTLIFGGLLLGTFGTLCICLVTCCLVEQKVLCFREQIQVTQSPVSKDGEMKLLKTTTSVEYAAITT